MKEKHRGKEDGKNFMNGDFKTDCYLSKSSTKDKIKS